MEETAKGAEKTVEKTATEAADKVEETAKAAKDATSEASKKLKKPYHLKQKNRFFSVQKRADIPPFFYAIFSRYCKINCTLRFPLNSLMSSL